MRRRVTPTLINTGGGGGLLLDDYPTTGAAYSLRYLRSAYVGNPVIRVRRSSNNDEQDFTPTEITDGTLETFVGVNDGLIVTWYDQSVNAFHATNATTTRQPYIITSGVLETLNGLPCIRADRTPDHKALNVVSNSKTVLSFAHHGNATFVGVLMSSIDGIWMGTSSSGFGNDNNEGFELGYGVQNAIIAVRNQVSKVIGENADVSSTQQRLYYYMWKCAEPIATDRALTHYNNITETSTNNFTNAPFVGGAQYELCLFGKFFGAPSGTINKTQEMILLEGYLDSERTAIQDNVNAYYSIY